MLQIRGVLVTEMLGEVLVTGSPVTWEVLATGIPVTGAVLVIQLLTVETLWAGVLPEMEVCPSQERSRQPSRRRVEEGRLLHLLKILLLLKES